jgi:hypothetical protein
MICITFFAPILVIIKQFQEGEKENISLIVGFCFLMVILIYITLLNTKYINRVTITNQIIESRNILGRLETFNCDKENVEIYIGSMTNKIGKKEGAITITSGKRRLVLLELYYDNYALLKSRLIALEKE